MDLEKYLVIAGAIIAGASMALNVIAPLTASKWDNKLLGWLRKASELLALEWLRPAKK